MPAGCQGGKESGSSEFSREVVVVWSGRARERRQAYPLGREDGVVLPRGQHRRRDRLELLPILPINHKTSYHRPHDLSEKIERDFARREAFKQPERDREARRQVPTRGRRCDDDAERDTKAVADSDSKEVAVAAKRAGRITRSGELCAWRKRSRRAAGSLPCLLGGRGNEEGRAGPDAGVDVKEDADELGHHRSDEGWPARLPIDQPAVPSKWRG